MGLFTPIYMKGNLSVNQARKAIAMVKQMTDQAKLAEIAREGKDKSVRKAAVDRLEDGMLLADLALNDSGVEIGARFRLEELRDAKAMEKLLARHPKLGLDYIGRAMDDVVTDQAALERLARTAVCDSVRVEAVRRLKSQSALEDIALHNGDPKMRRMATCRLTNPDVLAKIASEDEDGSVRRAAVDSERMTDGALLARLALEDEDPEVRYAAVQNKHLTDSHALTQYVLHEPEKRHRYLTLVNHDTFEDSDVKKIMRETDDPNIRSGAILKLDDIEALEKIATTSHDRHHRLYAVRNTAFTDQEKLAQIAIRDECEYVGEECVKFRITDPALMRRVALEAVNAHTRRLAVERLGRGATLQSLIPTLNASDAAALEKIATQDAEAFVRLTAVKNTGFWDEDALERIATAPDSTAYIGPRIEAAVKLSRRDPDRALAPLVAILKEEREADGSLLIGKRHEEAARFLMKYYRETADPEAKALIASLPDDQPLGWDAITGWEEDRLIFKIPR